MPIIRVLRQERQGRQITSVSPASKINIYEQKEIEKRNFSHSCLLNSRYGDTLRSTKWEKLKWGSAFHFIAGFATLWGQV